LNNTCVKLAIHFSLEAKIVKNYLYLSKLATQMVTLTPLENLSLLLYEPQNKNFNYATTKSLILHTLSIFFRGGHITKIWSKKIFFMKTLSKLGALTVTIYIKVLVQRSCSAQTQTRIGLLAEIPRSGVQIPCLYSGPLRRMRTLCYQAQTPVRSKSSVDEHNLYFARSAIMG
jgi:hypothetical protein